MLTKFLKWWNQPIDDSITMKYSGSTLLHAIKNTDNPLMQSLASWVAKTEKEQQLTGLELVRFEFWVDFKKRKD